MININCMFGREKDKIIWSQLDHEGWLVKKYAYQLL